MPRWTEHTIDGVSDFVKAVELERHSENAKGNTADFIFRGQADDLPLLPKVGRKPLHHDLENREQLILTEFERTSLGLIDLVPETKLDSLSLAQHHGLPTRMLDWTYGALIALWFAIEQRPDKDSRHTNSVVWLLKTQVDDFIKPGHSSPFENQKTKIYRPQYVARCISAQSGAFTLHQYVKSKKEFLALEKNTRYASRLVKFVIPKALVPEMKVNLSGCGVNRASVYPDLDGLCTHLAWRYFDQ